MADVYELTWRAEGVIEPQSKTYASEDKARARFRDLQEELEGTPGVWACEIALTHNGQHVRKWSLAGPHPQPAPPAEPT